jgi:hypothetical protein
MNNRESERSDSTDEVGELALSEDPAERHIKQPMLGTTSSAQKLEQRITETASDSRAGETFAGVGFHKPCSPD